MPSPGVEVTFAAPDAPETAAAPTSTKSDPNVRSRKQSQKLKKAKRKSRRVVWKEQKWTSHKPRAMTPNHEYVFTQMQLRKLERKMEGRKTQKQSQQCQHIFVFILCILMIYAGTYDDDDHTESLPENTALQDWYLLIVILWVFVSYILINAMANTAFLRPLYWMLIYLPVMTLTAYVSFYDEGVNALKDEDLEHVRKWSFGHYLAILLVAVECLTVTIFVMYYYAYPKLIRSQWFQHQPGRPAWYWNAKVITDWTMTYFETDRKFRKRYTCKYVGGFHRDTGLPHGQGRWYDDAYEGEILTGYWLDGKPVAPFVSHHYGSGNALKAVRIGYFKATDDEWDGNAFFAKNNNPPTAGVSSVECSVSGSFYNHLPSAELIEGPYNTVGQDNADFMQKVIQQLIHMDDTEVGRDASTNSQTVQIKANDPRGVQVSGHYYEPTGEVYAKDPESITVVVKRTNHNRHLLQNHQNFMPRPTLTTKKFDTANVIEYNKPGNDEGDDDAQGKQEGPRNNSNNTSSSSSSTRGFAAELKVVGWVPTTTKDALVFIPGYSTCMRDALKSFGQFVAMSSLGTHVYPIMYVWPNATHLSYPSASHAAASTNNDANFLKLIQGLAKAGVRNVHIMSHSMGAQTLLGVFRNKDDNPSARSEVSKCFRLMPAFAASNRLSTRVIESGNWGDDSHLMVCKTITMLNPDFPVAAFVDRGFRSIRQVCDTITLVADRQDMALFGSSACNGIGTYLGYQQPTALRPKLDKSAYKPQLGLQDVVGRSIDLLHFPDEWLDEDDANKHLLEERLVFQERAPLTLSADEEEADDDHLWLDMDVIDTTGLDTNIEGVRHGGYNLNPMLLKDIEELISTGNRAMSRSTLLYRDGNTFTYAHAPSFVAA